ncbi:uncharacterized protein N7515_007282 [Penicillium bovifimosum]|uniref:MARVEL domain-containing protein n=1 Tax=Penicillium bovifimosum TaxID=126998 RepID=A0A9W9GWN2_9EURO|nr:uncharacterized protein N7515_007282 [Penicillium bovifimosum]KAJ5131243.1 hypothetical protein N7515_007282 [Penicillium bovifimosum]
MSDETYPSWSLEALPRKERKWLSLFSLRFGAVLCTMTAIICFAWAMQEHNRVGVATDGLGSAFAAINLGTVSYGFVWSSVVLIVVLCNCAVHPGIIIAFDCIAFVAQIITVSFELHELAYWHAGGYKMRNTRAADVLYGVECLACSRKAGRQNAKQTFEA